MEIANEIRSVYGKIKKQVSRLFLKRRVGFLRFWHPKHYRFATSTTLVRLAWTRGVALQLGVLARQLGYSLNLVVKVLTL